MFNHKKILFIGPLGNPVNKFVNKFDYVIRTNNFFSIKPNILHSYRCDILITNHLYTTRYHYIIKKYMHKLKYLFVYGTTMKTFISNKVHPKHLNKIIDINYSLSNQKYIVRGNPLQLSKLLYYITQNYKPWRFFITGINFYQTKTIDTIYLPGYAIKEIVNKHQQTILEQRKHHHDIESNIGLLRYLYHKYDWIDIAPSVLAIITYKVMK